MDHARIGMAVAMAIWMSVSYCEARKISSAIQRTDIMEATSERQVEVQNAKAQSYETKSPEVDKLPEGKGKDVTLRLCTKCHAATVFVVQRHDLDGWYNIIDQMTGKGLQASDQDIETVARYLATSFPAASTDAPPKGGDENRGNLRLYSSVSPSKR